MRPLYSLPLLLINKASLCNLLHKVSSAGRCLNEADDLFTFSCPACSSPQRPWFYYSCGSQWALLTGPPLVCMKRLCKQVYRCRKFCLRISTIYTQVHHRSLARGFLIAEGQEGRREVCSHKHFSPLLATADSRRPAPGGRPRRSGSGFVVKAEALKPSLLCHCSCRRAT